jgi:hypothetical protein
MPKELKNNAKTLTVAEAGEQYFWSLPEKFLRRRQAGTNSGYQDRAAAPRAGGGLGEDA